MLRTADRASIRRGWYSFNRRRVSLKTAQKSAFQKRSRALFLRQRAAAADMFLFTTTYTRKKKKIDQPENVYVHIEKESLKAANDNKI